MRSGSSLRSSALTAGGSDGSRHQQQRPAAQRRRGPTGEPIGEVLAGRDEHVASAGREGALRHCHGGRVSIGAGTAGDAAGRVALEVDGDLRAHGPRSTQDHDPLRVQALELGRGRRGDRRSG